MATLRERDMIEITDGITRICVGMDTLAPAAEEAAAAGLCPSVPRSPTGVRVTIDFVRDTPLPTGERVRVLYDFAGDGLREAVGMARPIRAVIHWGQIVAYHYRLSHWMVAASLQHFVEPNVRQRTDGHQVALQHSDKQSGMSG